MTVFWKKAWSPDLKYYIRAVPRGIRNGFTWDKERLYVGERTALSGSQRPPKTFIAAATNIRSGRYDYP